MRLTLRHVFALVTFTLAACSGNEPDPASPGPGTDQKLILSLSAHVDTIPESTSKTFTARITDQTGFLKSVPVTWTSTDPNVASVASGYVTGVAPGDAWVIASITGARDSVHVVVIQNDLMLDVQPSAAAVAMGDTIDFVATLRTRSGDILAVNSFSWTSSDTTAAQFVGGGSLKAKREGDLLVTAEAMRRRGEGTVRIFKSPVASVNITPSTASVYKGTTVTLDAIPRDQNGRVVEGDVTWGSSDNTRATVNQDGVVTGISSGTVVITATAETKTGSATIAVLGAPAATVQLSLPSPTLLVGTEMQASATLLDASGQPVTGRTIAWQSGNPSIATVNSNGTVKGVTEGDVNVSAIADGVIATQRLSVKGRTAVSVTINPAAPNVTVGQNSQLIAKVLDQNGLEIPGASVSWSSANPAIASVSSGGLLNGVSSGSTTINATSGSLSATATVTVVSAAVASVRVTPTSASLSSGGQTTLAAQALDANQNVLAGRAVSWSSQSPTVASVNSSGVVTAVSSGSATITATIEGKSASAAIFVAMAPPNPVSAVAVTLSKTTLNVGEQSQGSVVLTDAGGKVLTGRVVTWFSLDSTVAKVSSNGLVTAMGPGTVAIIARSENVSGSASVNVNQPTLAKVARVRVDAPTQDLKVGQQVQTTVTLFDSAGNILTGRTITYTTQDPSIVTISSTGVVKGAGIGFSRMVATSGGVSGTEGFSVAAASTNPVATISVSPSSNTLSVGQTKQLSASAADAQGVAVATTYTWTTSNPAVATVSNGLITAVGAGSATITAASSGITGSSSVTVTAPPPSNGVVSSVVVNLSPSAITVGGTSQATAIAKDINGVMISGKSATWSLGVTGLATITANGVVSGLLAGTVPVRATIDGVTGTANLTIGSLLPPPPASTVVELPRIFLNYSFPARTGQTIVVPPGGNLQTAINNAQRGDEIVLTAGAKYTGNFTLPAKSGTGWVVIRSDKLSQLPPMGTRVDPSLASLMPTIETASTSAAFVTASGASGYWLAGLNVTISSSVTQLASALIALGEVGWKQTTLASIPKDLVLDRLYIHAQTTSQIMRCIALNSAATQISDSYVAECHANGYDTQAIWGGNGPGPFKIVNNMLQGAGENVMFGGMDPSVPGLVPSDIEFRRNYVYTPLSWMGKWLKKNLLETKNVARFLIEENVFDGSWKDAQGGMAIVLRSSNQDGGCRWCRTTDVTFRRNLIRNTGGGIGFVGTGDNVAGTDTALRRVLVSETVIDGISTGVAQGSDPRAFMFMTGASYITVQRTVAVGNLRQGMWVDKSRPSAGVVFKDLVLNKGQYGIAADGTTEGDPSLRLGTPGYLWTNVQLIGSGGSTYPAGTTWLAGESASTLAASIRATVMAAVQGVDRP
jgi:uncharacterized protein YjdB